MCASSHFVGSMNDIHHKPLTLVSGKTGGSCGLTSQPLYSHIDKADAHQQRGQNRTPRAFSDRIGEPLNKIRQRTKVGHYHGNTGNGCFVPDR